MAKYRIWLNDKESIITEKEENGLYKNLLTLKRYNPEELIKTEQINDCADCAHLRTPKGKQCNTISRIIKEDIRNKGLPLDPIILIPLLDRLGETCKRYVPKVNIL